MIKRQQFPKLENANEDGLLAMGGDLSVDTLVSAYSQGIFPWYNEGQPILWWSPDPRLVLFPSEVKVSRSLRKIIRQQRFTLRCNTHFESVIKGCAQRGTPIEFAEPADTWITSDMQLAYCQLHNMGYAQSIEVWQADELVGGLYGVTLGHAFFGESMFSRVSNASKVALWALCQWLLKLNFQIIDCQVSNEHLLSMGSRELPRTKFMEYLSNIDIQHPAPEFADGFANFIDEISRN